MNLLCATHTLAPVGVLSAQILTRIAREGGREGGRERREIETARERGGRERERERGRSACRGRQKPHRGYSRLRTHTALGSYDRAIPRSIGPPWGRCVFLISSNPCTVMSGIVRAMRCVGAFLQRSLLASVMYRTTSLIRNRPLP